MSKHTLRTLLFVSPPAFPYDALYNKCILRLRAALPGTNIVVKRAELAAPTLVVSDTKLFRQIDRADIIVAEISDRDPDVMVALGYCIANCKVMMTIARHGSDGQPVDHMFKIPDTYYRSLDGDFGTLLETLKMLVRDRIRFVDQGSTSRSCRITCYRDVRTARLDKMFRKASSQIDVLTPDLAYFAANFAGGVKTALSNSDRLSVRLLTIDPTGHIALRKAIQSRTGVCNQARELHNIIKILQQEQGRPTSAFSVFRSRISKSTLWLVVLSMICQRFWPKTLCWNS